VRATRASNAFDEILITDLAVVVIEARTFEDLRAGGAVGALQSIDRAIGGSSVRLSNTTEIPLAQMRDAVSCAAMEAPEELRQLKEWPAVQPFCPLTIFPKGLVLKASTKWWGRLTLYLSREAAAEQSFDVRLWEVPRVKAALRDYGYNLAVG